MDAERISISMPGHDDEASIAACMHGNLSPDEIHRLASKTKKTIGAHEGEKASCHSDYVDDDAARDIQRDHDLVQLSTAEAHNISKHDSVI